MNDTQLPMARTRERVRGLAPHFITAMARPVRRRLFSSGKESSESGPERRVHAGSHSESFVLNLTDPHPSTL